LPDNNGDPTPEIEVGWHLKKSAWGKGYATEAGQAVLNYGFNVLKLPIIYAVVNPANTASIQVTQRLGMTPLGRTQQYYGKELELFKLEAPDL
jgi:[ribosomal protein S5]-alanine N-acetyltransferase